MREALFIGIILCGAAQPAIAGAPRRDKPVPVVTSHPFMLPAGTARLQPMPKTVLLSARAPGRVADASILRWGPGSTLPEVTARAGGSYAVHDIMSEQSRPRHPKSPLSTAFVLRLDGQDDSPPFSIGGGGVAAAVWRAVPK